MLIDESYVRMCDGLLFIGEAPGALKERYLAISIGKIVFYDTDDIPFGEHVTESRRNQAVVKTWERRYD